MHSCTLFCLWVYVGVCGSFIKIQLNSKYEQEKKLPTQIRVLNEKKRRSILLWDASILASKYFIPTVYTYLLL